VTKPMRRRTMRSNRAQRPSAARRGMGAVALKVGVEGPDQRAYLPLCGTLLIGEGVQLVHQPFRMHPAQGVSPTANCPASSLSTTALRGKFLLQRLQLAMISPWQLSFRPLSGTARR